jgi:hypothetical protein
MKKLELKSIFLTQDEFNRDLDINLVIKTYPNKMRKYYICEYTSIIGEKSDIKVNIKK